MGAFFALNILDACATSVALSAGAAEELNPIMRLFAEDSIAVFVVVKMISGIVAVSVFWAGRHAMIGRVGGRDGDTSLCGGCRLSRDRRESVLVKLLSKIVVGDCKDCMHEIPSESVQTCVTSPPYFALRDYDDARQIGQEKTPAEYVSKLVKVFREVRRLLRSDGTLWLNLGDSYSPRGGKREGIKRKDLIGIPWRVALALQADGWYLRQDIIWQKPNVMPEPVKDRCVGSHEYVFLLSKNPKYYFDHETMREPAVQAGRVRKDRFGGKKHSGETTMHSDGSVFTGSNTRTRRSVWSVNTKPFKGAHFAVFPPELIEPCVLAGAPEGATVLDPFAGAGTTGLVAAKNNRHFIGIELNTEYADIARQRMSDAARGERFG